MEYLLESMS